MRFVRDKKSKVSCKTTEIFGFLAQCTHTNSFPYSIPIKDPSNIIDLWVFILRASKVRSDVNSEAVARVFHFAIVFITYLRESSKTDRFETHKNHEEFF